MKGLLKNSIFFLLIGLATAACSEHKVIYHEYHSISSAGWEKKDTLIYQIPATDSAHVVRLYAEIRNGLNYPYSDLYLVIKQNMADSLKWQTDTIKFQLADSLGKWIGTGGENYYQSEQPVCNITLPKHPFLRTIRVSQGMKDNKLIGITDVGFRIEYP